MQTNRLRFQNIDQSFSVGQPTALQGACVIKASKGLNYPKLVAKGDTQTFLNLFGTPSSTYPGAQEALDFLNYFSLWVSAPGGADSYFGGTYLTTLGSLESFYQVTEDADGLPSVNFLTDVQCDDDSPLSAGASQAYDDSPSSVIVSDIPPEFCVAASITGAVLTFTREDGTTAVVEFTKGTATKLQVLALGTLTDVGVIDPALGTITISENGDYINPDGSGSKDLDFANIPDFANSGFVFKWIYNIESYVCMAVFQNSPRITTGNFLLSSGTAVDTRQYIYPGYTTTFIVSGSGSTGTAITFTICGVSVSATIVAATTPVLVTTAIQTALASIHIPGYTIVCTPANSEIAVSYNGAFAAPTLSFDSGFAGYTPMFQVIHTITSTEGGTVGATNSVTLGGQTLTLSGTLNSASAIGTEIVSDFAVQFPTYTFSGTSAVTILYPATLPTPIQMSLGLGFTSKYTSTMTSYPTTTTGTATVNSNYNTATFTYTELAYTGYTYSKTFTVSPDSTKTDAQGNSLYAETVMDGNNFLGAISYLPFYDLLPGYTWSTDSASLVGERYVSSVDYDPTTLGAVLTLGWNSMSLPEMINEVDLFFDPECSSTVAALMYALRSTTYIFSTFITGIKVANGISISTSDVNNVVNALITARAGYPSATGLAYYCNEFYMKESYNSTSYWNIPIGSIAAMLGLIMDSRLGGAAPMFTNEGNPSVGGQLGKSVIRQKYNFDANSLDLLDSAGVNPIILDTFYGLMITSQKTAQSAINLTDWSYLGHQMSFDLFEAEIKQSVMMPQIGKLIDNYHMQLRQNQAQMILDKRLTGATAIWSAGEVYVTEVNTAETKAQNNFMIKIRVKVTPFSEYVTLIFNNVGQTSSVTAS